MRINHRIAAASLLVLTVGAAEAQISKDTYNCQKGIAKEGAKFAKQIQKNLDKCLAAVSKCNLDADPDPCISPLLVPNKGRCAVGKLADDDAYWGNSATPNPASASKIGKAFMKFSDGIAKKCEVNNPNIDWGYLGLSVPASHQALVSDLNDDNPGNDFDPVGIACRAHQTVGAIYPDLADGFILQIASHPEWPNFPESVFNALLGGNCN